MNAEIDAYLESLPQDVRDALQRLRATIARAAPEAVEQIAYGVPAFKYRGRPFVSYGAGRKGGHCAFYVQSPDLMNAHRDELTGCDWSGATIRFSPNEPLSDELVTKFVRWRTEEIDALDATRRRPSASRS